MVRMLEDMNNKLNLDIQHEIKTSSEMEEMLLRLLEETCGRLEIALRH